MLCGTGVCAQLHLMLCNPMAPQLARFSVHGIFLARIVEWARHFLLQGISLNQSTNPHLLCLCVSRWFSSFFFFTTVPSGKSPCCTPEANIILQVNSTLVKKTEECSSTKKWICLIKLLYPSVVPGLW